MLWRKAAFIFLILFLLSPLGSPPVALALGLLLAFTIGNPFPELEGAFTKYLLQTSVVLLGFGMQLSAIVEAGRDGILFTIATIFGTLILGYFLGKLLKVEDKTSTLISSGTAICGGSAIGAVAPAIEAKSDQISLALGTVFVLNSVALFLFPLIGHALGLSQNQFGIWAAVAIHDTSSVVGAAQSYGAEALAVATTVKLARALWIAPLAFMFALIYRRSGEGGKAKIAVPWFILFFVAAASFRSYVPAWVPTSLFDSIQNLAKAGMTITLFLIGASLSRETLKKFGYAALFEGVLLWIVISLVSLWAVMKLV